MSNGFKKGRIKLGINKAIKASSCIVNGKFCYYLSLCTEKKPFLYAEEEKIKLEYPEKNAYGIIYFNPNGGLINAITFMLRDAWTRTKKNDAVKNDAVFVPHGQKGGEYEIRSGGGVCEYICSHKPLNGKDLELFNNFVGRYKKDLPIKDINEYLEGILSKT